MRPLRAKGLERYLSPRRLHRVRERAARKPGRTLAVASLAPPPFPFTALVMATAALQYPRGRRIILPCRNYSLAWSVFVLLAASFQYIVGLAAAVESPDAVECHADYDNHRC